MKAAIILVTLTVVAGLLILWLDRLGTISLARSRRRLARGRATSKKASHERDVAELDVLHDQVIDVARSRGIRVPEKTASGHGGIGVAFSDGTTFWYFRNLAVRRRAAPAVQMNSTHLGSPPLPVSRWNAEQCRDWLAEHGD